MTYVDYLASPSWQARREMTIAAAGGRCMLCYAAGALEVHHRTYERLGHELPSDLIALCSTCHEAYHRWAAPAPRATEADRRYRRRLALEASVDAAFTGAGAGPTGTAIPTAKPRQTCWALPAGVPVCLDPRPASSPSPTPAPSVERRTDV